jgi:hypothetical protein
MRSHGCALFYLPLYFVSALVCFLDLSWSFVLSSFTCYIIILISGFLLNFWSILWVSYSGHSSHPYLTLIESGSATTSLFVFLLSVLPMLPIATVVSFHSSPLVSFLLLVISTSTIHNYTVYTDYTYIYLLLAASSLCQACLWFPFSLSLSLSLPLFCYEPILLKLSVAVFDGRNELLVTFFTISFAQLAIALFLVPFCASILFLLVI